MALRALSGHKNQRAEKIATKRWQDDESVNTAGNLHAGGDAARIK